ncbi:MAG: hypothetical protein O7F08_08340 [Deltaproteobacteria bacterium]|nr:hypothetical protein [Deltaproteobacteria bacterium]
MERLAPVLVFLGLSLPAAASASDHDTIVFDVVYGATVSKYSFGTKWQPTLWIDGSYGVAGPLHLGAYFQWLGEKFPLDNPGFGGGGLIALRRNIKKVRLTGAFGGGYLGVPVPVLSIPDAPYRHEGSGTITAFAGLGYGFIDFLGIEFRGRWARYFRMPAGTPDSAWSIEAGLTFFIE